MRSCTARGTRSLITWSEASYIGKRRDDLGLGRTPRPTSWQDCQEVGRGMPVTMLLHGLAWAPEAQPRRGTLRRSTPLVGAVLASWPDPAEAQEHRRCTHRGQHEREHYRHGPPQCHGGLPRVDVGGPPRRPQTAQHRFPGVMGTHPVRVPVASILRLRSCQDHGRDEPAVAVALPRWVPGASGYAAGILPGSREGRRGT
jgi:hypothetical protein